MSTGKQHKDLQPLRKTTSKEANRNFQKYKEQVKKIHSKSPKKIDTAKLEILYIGGCSRSTGWFFEKRHILQEGENFEYQKVKTFPKRMESDTSSFSQTSLIAVLWMRTREPAGTHAMKQISKNQVQIKSVNSE